MEGQCRKIYYYERKRKSLTNKIIVIIKEIITENILSKYLQEKNIRYETSKI